MANTFELIVSYTVPVGGAANIDLTSIPATFTELMVLYSMRTTDAGPYNDVTVQLNNTNSSSSRVVYGLGGGTGAYVPNPSQSFFAEANGVVQASTFSNGLLCIPSYTSSNGKTLYGDAVVAVNSTSALISTSGATYSAVTPAVNAIKLTPAGGTTIVQHSSIAIYGIKKN